MDNKDPFKEIRDSSVSAIKHFIDDTFGVYFDMPLPGGITMLHRAAEKSGNANVAKVLISMGLDVNAKEKNGFTPLHVAACYGSIDVINIFVSNGANIEAVQQDGYTPLHMAVSQKNIEAAKVLIAKGANLYAKGNQGQTMLYIAKLNNDKEMIKYLSGISILNEDSEGFLEILQDIVYKHGKELFLDKRKCKAFIADYTKGDYKEESLCLYKAIEAGVSKAIHEADFFYLRPCMEQQQKKLQEMGMDVIKATYIVDALEKVFWFYIKSKKI